MILYIYKNNKRILCTYIIFVCAVGYPLICVCSRRESKRLIATRRLHLWWIWFHLHQDCHYQIMFPVKSGIVGYIFCYYNVTCSVMPTTVCIHKGCPVLS